MKTFKQYLAEQNHRYFGSHEIKLEYPISKKELDEYFRQFNSNHEMKIESWKLSRDGLTVSIVPDYKQGNFNDRVLDDIKDDLDM